MVGAGAALVVGLAVVAGAEVGRAGGDVGWLLVVGTAGALVGTTGALVGTTGALVGTTGALVGTTGALVGTAEVGVTLGLPGVLAPDPVGAGVWQGSPCRSHGHRWW